MAEQPFDEREKRYFLAEILKHAPVAPEYLLQCIQQWRIQPSWNDLALPNGRSVHACQRAFAHLLHQMSTGYQVASEPVTASAASVRPKKRASAGETSTSAPTASAPYTSFPAVNDPAASHASSIAAHSPGGKQQKKRGRPSKAEAELRATEAAERGEVWPRPKRVKAKPSIEGGIAPPHGISSTHEGAGGPSTAVEAPPTDNPTEPALTAREAKPEETKDEPTSLEKTTGEATHGETKDVRTDLKATASAAAALGGKGQALRTSDPVAGIEEHAVHGQAAPPETSALVAPPPSSQEQPTEEQPTEEQPTSQQPISSSREAESYQTPYQ